jgi:AcrR family transcriptional regulator
VNKRLATQSTDNREPYVRRGRAQTEQRLIDVALDLIRSQGILAGLNLREVAAGAGVNRGNIYHYFGSRQELLRAAINRQFKALVESIREPGKTARFVHRRVKNFLKHNQDQTNDSQLRALLVLDGDTSVDPIPLYEAGLKQLKDDVARGDIHSRHDLEALQVALSAFGRGYRIFRLPYAKRVGIPPKELDERVSNILATWLTAMTAPPAGKPEP